MSDYTTIAEVVTFGAALVGIAASISWGYRAHIQALAKVQEAFYDAQAKVIGARAAAIQALAQKLSPQELTDFLGKHDAETEHDPIGWLSRFDWES